jgi:hypothetical protein
VPEGGTLASMISSDDKLAMAFVVFRIGNVRLAENQDELLSGSRAVMADGAYYDGLITEMRRPDGLKIGRAAAPLMEATLRERIEQRSQLLRVHLEKKRFFEDAIRRIEDCSRPVDEKDRLEALAFALGDLADRRADARRRLYRISTQVDPELLDAEKRSQVLLNSLKTDRDELIDSRASLRSKIEEVKARLGAGEQTVGSYLCLAHRRRQFRSVVTSAAQMRSLHERYRGHPTRNPARIASDAEKAADDAKQRHRELGHEIRAALGRYAIDFPDALEGYADVPIIGTVKPWVSDGIAMLEDNELIHYRQHADEAADRVSRLFKTTFIHELNSRFGQLHSEMEKLSAALRTRPLHGETYRLTELVKPEFDDLYHLAKDSETDERVLDALFGRAEPRDERHARALGQIERLLADESFDFTVFQDYRSYFTYDLKMRDVATGRTTSFDRRRGVASGAERQVPFYVVIGAALASAYHGVRHATAPSDLGMGLAVFDEAFSKMDGPNQRTLLDFYRAIGLQVVIAAPTEKRAVVYENLDECRRMNRRGFSTIASLIDNLLARHERNPAARNLIAVIDKDGFANIDLWDAFDEELAALERAGGIELIQTGPKTERRVTSARLKDAGALYRKAERRPAGELACEAVSELRSQPGLPVGAVGLIDDAVAAWTRGVSYIGIRNGDGRTLANVIGLAIAVGGRMSGDPQGEQDFRTFSRLTVGDSKALEKNVRQVAAAMTKIFAGMEEQARLDPEELLASAGIRRLPQPILLHGDVSLDGLPFPAMPYVGIPTDCAGGIGLLAKPDYVLTIENFTSFVRHIREVARSERAVVIYSGGFPSRPTLATIIRLAARARVPTFHWGDMDAGGAAYSSISKGILLASIFRCAPI